MMSPLKFDKRLTTHLVQRGELTSEELNQYILSLNDLTEKSRNARQEPEVEEEMEQDENTTESALELAGHRGDSE